MSGQKNILSFLIIFTIVFVSRIFFLGDGYGVEEDSWGLVVNAFEMKHTGHYTASRFPGHPLQEYTYRLIYDQPPFVYNLFSAIFSALGAAVFSRILAKLGVAMGWAGAAALAFTPVVYIAGVCTIDYAWTMFFVLCGFSLLIDRKILLAGIMIGLAASCRVTALVFILPFIFLLTDTRNFARSFRDVLLLSVPAGIITLLAYTPAYLQYGRAFFDYSDQFPYPPFTKIFYKATIGVFGITGCIAVLAGFVAGIKSWRKKELAEPVSFPVNKLLWCIIIIILLHIVAYMRLPQKSAYMMPVVPFVILFMAITLHRKFFLAVSVMMMISSFIFSVNLTDSLRGAGHSSAAFKLKVSGQEIFIDPVSGPIFSERSKRLNKMRYCEEVLRTTDTISQKSIIIGGWWYNELLTAHLQGRPQRSNVTYRFYSEEKEMRDSISKGWKIFFLPEQDLYNDQMFGQHCTNELAQPFPVK